MFSLKINNNTLLGNDNLHELTSVLGYTRLRIELQAFDGREGHIEFSFSIDDESLQYMIHVSMISGNISGRDCFFLYGHRPIHSLQKLCPLVAIFGENPIDFSQWPL